MRQRRTAAKGTTKLSLAAPEVAEQPYAVYAEKIIPLILSAAGILAYSNSLHAPFVFDDRFHIADNPLVHQFWPPWQILAHSSRPVVHLSLAWNYALGGLNPWGYHVFNLVVHVLAALVLYGVVRRTLSSGLLQAKWGPSAPRLAGLVASIWLLHPVQTESVTYIVQRGESLMGLFYLLTLYCVIRQSESRRSRQADSWWKAAAVVSCLLGMASKGVMTTAPIVVLLYDRAFLSRSWSGLMRRKGLYIGLAATWLVYPLLLANSPAEWKNTAGFGYTGVSWLQYAMTQPAVILHYLRLALWPDSLCLDYAWPVAGTVGEILPQSIVILGLLAATIWAWWRSPAMGFLGVWFFVILAPSSSFIPIADLAFEHRMYLSLAAVITLAVAGVYLFGQRFSGAGKLNPRILGWAAASLVVVTMASLTVRRNGDYASELAIWNDTVRKRPNNARAQYNVGDILGRQGKIQDAVFHLEEAIRLKPDYAEAHVDLGMAMLFQGKNQEAIWHWERAIQLNPNLATAQNNLAYALAEAGRSDEAIPHYEQAIRINPDYAQAQINLARLLATVGPAQGRNPTRALDLAYRACQLTGNRLPDYLDVLGMAYAADGRFDEAIKTAQNAVEIARSAGQQDLVKQIETRRELYRLQRLSPRH